MSTTLAASAFSSNPLWYLTRSTAVVGFVLLTIGAVLGVASTQRTLASRAWPRFATQALHRNVNVLGLLFVVVHIITSVADSYVNVSVASAVVPFASSYKTVGVMWGTVAFDVFLIVAVTGFLRVRMTEPVWPLASISRIRARSPPLLDPAVGSSPCTAVCASVVRGLEPSRPASSRCVHGAVISNPSRCVPGPAGRSG